MGLGIGISGTNCSDSGGGGGGSIGAKPLKTGQVVSYVSGDDGSTQRGRTIDFFTLATNNAFGSSPARFSDLLGNQVYSLGSVMLDHSTDDGSSILGITYNYYGTWSTVLDYANDTLSTDGKTDWKLINRSEMDRLVYEKTDRNLDWSPLNQIATYATSNAYWWTSTSAKNNTARAKAFLNSTGVVGNEMQTRGKTLGGIRSLAVRYYTYAELGLTGGINPIVGCKLNKTGALVSQRTGDDGDLQEGRNVDWFTLGGNNPYGNTTRFLDEFGGTAYTSNIVIDWSTYDGTTVLGWEKSFSAAGKTWNNAIDEALIVSRGTFSSGWRLPNANELASIACWAIGGRLLSYAPFLDNSNARLWSSTTYAGLTTYATLLGNQNAVGLVATTKASGFYFKACRNFTVTGTTLT